MSVFNDTRSAIAQANLTFAAVDEIATDMAILLVSRLRRVKLGTANYNDAGGDALVALKRELNAFDARTREWSAR